MVYSIRSNWSGGELELELVAQPARFAISVPILVVVDVVQPASYADAGCSGAYVELLHYGPTVSVSRRWILCYSNTTMSFCLRALVETHALQRTSALSRESFEE